MCVSAIDIDGTRSHPVLWRLTCAWDSWQMAVLVISELTLMIGPEKSDLVGNDRHHALTLSSANLCTACCGTVEPHYTDDMTAHLDMELSHVPCNMLRIVHTETLNGKSFEIHRWTDQFTFVPLETAEGHEHLAGCRLTGSTVIPKQPGNIRVEVDAKAGTVGVKSTTLLKERNLSHKVHHLAFTDEKEAADDLKKASGFGHTSPHVKKYDSVDIFAAGATTGTSRE